MKVVIIGASHAGLTVAKEIKELSPNIEVTLLEKSEIYEFGYISNGINLVLDGVIKDLKEATSNIENITGKGVKILPNVTVSRIDSEKKCIEYLVGGNKPVKLVYDKLVVSTGSSPSQEHFQHKKRLDNVLFYKSYQDSVDALEKIQVAKSIAIFGSGYISLELLDSLKDLKKDLYYFPGELDLLSRYMDSEMIRKLKTKVRKSNVKVISRTPKIEFSYHENKVTSIICGQTVLPIDLVIDPDLLIPNVDLIEDIVKTNVDRTIVIDDNCKTSNKDIYAIGDIAPIIYPHHQTEVFMPLVNRAVRMARIVALSITGHKVKNELFHKTSATFVFDTFLGSTGLTETEAPFFGFDAKSIRGTFPLKTKFSKRPAFVDAKLVYDRITSKVIGIQLVSDEIVIEDLNLATTILQESINLEQLAVHNFTFVPKYTEPFHFLNNLAYKALVSK